MKSNFKNLTAFVLTFGLLALSGCRETRKDVNQEDTHIEGDSHMDENHMDSNDEHMQNDGEHLNDEQGHMDQNDDHMQD